MKCSVCLWKTNYVFFISNLLSAFCTQQNTALFVAQKTLRCRRTIDDCFLVVLLDISAAFDTTTQAIVLDRLRGPGYRQTWFNSYLYVLSKAFYRQCIQPSKINTRVTCQKLK